MTGEARYGSMLCEVNQVEWVHGPSFSDLRARASLADRAALTNHPVVKRTTHLSSSSPSSRHQRLGERAWVPAAKKTLHERFDHILECGNSVPWGFNAMSVGRMKQDGRKGLTSIQLLSILLFCWSKLSAPWCSSGCLPTNTHILYPLPNPNYQSIVACCTQSFQAPTVSWLVADYF